MTIDTTVGLIAHLPLNDILKGSCGVEFQLVEVDLTDGGLTAARALRDLYDLDLSHTFKIATPTPPPVVESPGGGDDQRTAATVAPPPTLDQLRGTVKGWSDADRATLVAYFERNGTDTADAEQVAEAIEAVANFHDVATAPSPAPVTVAAEAPTLPPTPDEGDDAPDAAIDDVKARYAALDDAGRTWVNAIGRQATQAGLSFHMNADSGGRRTMRRLRLMTALVALADGFDNDDAVRGSAANINAEIADSMAYNLGQVVGHLGADEAARFVEVVGALVDGQASMRWTNTGRCRVEMAA